MSREISLFPTYVKKENRVTNYCGVIFKSLYEESPKKFERFMGELLGYPEFSCVMGFFQQKKKGRNIPDLIMEQKEIRLFIENKTSDWFYEQQIRGYVNELQKGDVKDGSLLLLLTSELNKSTLDLIESIQNEKGEKRFIFAATYEELSEKLEDIAATCSPFFQNLCEDFNRYLDDEGLFPAYKTLLGSFLAKGNEIDHALYHTGKWHRRCAFFGAYNDKRIYRLARIEAVVYIEGDEKKVIHKNSGKKDDALILEAEKRAEECGFSLQMKEGCYFYLLDDLREINYLKKSKRAQWNQLVLKDMETSDYEKIFQMMKDGSYE